MAKYLHKRLLLPVAKHTTLHSPPVAMGLLTLLLVLMPAALAGIGQKRKAADSSDEDSSCDEEASTSTRESLNCNKGAHDKQEGHIPIIRA
jgi:hypothetical protein